MCISPFQREIEGERLNLPCGKCVECLSRRISAWSFRLTKEAEQSSSAFFITLTYAPEHVPRSKNNYKTLFPDHTSQFIKRLRKKTKNKIKYYVCGEYGGEYLRPHYHMILLNCPLSAIIGKKDSTQVHLKNIELNGKTPFYCDQWYYGHITIGQVNIASIGYTLKYMSKKSIIPIHQNDDRIKEFSRMSKGLGANYLTKDMVKWHKADMLNRMYCNLMDGKKIAMPRYYKDKIYTDYQKKKINKHLDNERFKKYINMTPEKLSKVLSKEYSTIVGKSERGIGRKQTKL